MTDGKFLALIRRVSGNHTLYVTPNQLYAQYCRSQRKGYRALLVVGLLLGAIAVGMVVNRAALTGVAILLGVGALACLGTAAKRAFARLPALTSFQETIDKWRHAGRPIDKLLTQPGLETPPPQWEESDIYDYGVERLLLVERDLLVDLFVRNEFHAQERTLVLSERGYPPYLVSVATRCLQDNPQLPVYLLHDATGHGTTMAQRVQDSHRLPLEGHPILDLGIFPEDVKLMPNQKAMRPHWQNYGMPLDFLLFSTLGAGVARAMAENVVFAELLQASHTGAADMTGDVDFG